MKPLYAQFKEQKDFIEKEKLGNQNFGQVTGSVQSYYESLKNSTLIFAFYSQGLPDIPNKTSSGIALIFKQSSNWGWIFSISNGIAYTKSLNNGSWGNWTSLQ